MLSYSPNLGVLMRNKRTNIHTCFYSQTSYYFVVI